MARKAQSTMFDKRIDDPDLERLLGEAVEREPAVRAYRTTRKSIRAHIEQKHPDLIAPHADGASEDGSKGWVLCGEYRFRPRAVEREEGEVKIGAGVNFTCPIERV